MHWTPKDSIEKGLFVDNNIYDFVYNDYVLITNGFYKGSKGKVKGAHIIESNRFSYQVEIDENRTSNFNTDQLEKI